MFLSKVKMYAEYEDNAKLFLYGENEDECMQQIVNAASRHGKCIFYCGVTDGEHYVDGNYYDYYDDEHDVYVVIN